MTQTVLHPRPGRGAVLRAQLRSVAMSLRLPAAAAAALVVALSAVLAVMIARGGGPFGFRPEQPMIPAFVALLLPVIVWRGQEHFGHGFLWTLPVDRRWQALARVGAGWIWLMAGVALFVLWQLGLALASGAQILATETVWLLPPSTLATPPPGTLDPATLRAVQARPEPLLWLVPFTGATVAYLVSSALALGLRHPLRWIFGLGFALFLLATAGEATRTVWLLELPHRLLVPFFFGPYGFDTVATARTDFLKVGTRLTTGEPVIVWRALPDLAHWAIATLLWTAAGLAALWAAASRHRERRPA